MELKEQLIIQKKRIERALACGNFDNLAVMCNNLHCRFCADEYPNQENAIPLKKIYGKNFKKIIEKLLL